MAKGNLVNWILGLGTGDLGMKNREWSREAGEWRLGRAVSSSLPDYQITVL